MLSRVRPYWMARYLPDTAFAVSDVLTVRRQELLLLRQVIICDVSQASSSGGRLLRHLAMRLSDLRSDSERPSDTKVLESRAV